MSDEARTGLSLGISASPSSTRLHGRWLAVARVGWLALFVVTVAPFALSLPGYPGMIAHPTSANAAISPTVARALLNAGISLETYGWTSFAILIVVVGTSLILALLLAWRRSDDWMTLAVSLFIIAYPISGIGIPQNGASTSPNTSLAVAMTILESVPSFIIILGVLLLFPNGRFAPRWAWVIFLALSLWTLGLAVAPASFGGALFLGYPVAFLTIIMCMIYRYRRVSTPTERLQTKWIVGGLIVTLVANQVFWIPTGFTPLGQTLYPALCYLAYQVSFALSPIAFFIAIQRYRLYDIDTIINRALVYGALSITLAGIYAACVIVAQAFVCAFATGSAAQQPIVIVATTLLIAALFGPLRARLQAFVDRRFYRRKYDAVRTVAAFSATLRQEVDLASLQEQLLATVEETVQPAHASIWLLPPTARRSPGALSARDE